MMSLVWTGGLAATGCVLPPELEPGGADAGPSSPPVLVEANPAPDFSFPGPLVLDHQDQRQLSLTIDDRDLGDVTFIRLFVDYGRPDAQPPYAECQAAPTGMATRIAVCTTNSLCNPIGPTDTADHVLEAMASDHQFLSSGDPGAVDQPLFRAVAEPSTAAYSFRSWVMRCNPPQ